MAMRLEQRTPTAHWTESIHLHNCQDAVEDEMQAAFIRTPSDLNLDRYILALNESMKCDRALLDALLWEKQWRWDGRVHP
jgi:hypothetical protein